MHKPRRALVLGCGGVLGGAWTIAALESLERELGWDAREADLLIGTSVGAVLAALLGAGVPVTQMVASQLGTAPDCVWNHERDTGGIFPPLPRAKLIAPHWLTSRQPSNLSWFSAAVGLLPEGSADMSGFRRLINHAVPDGTWVKHPNTWMMAVDQDSGERVALGKAGSPTPPIADAVCASYGVPAWCPPVQIEGRRYVDGGIASPTSADFVLGQAIDEVIVLAPMASHDLDRPLPLTPAWIERQVRRYMTQVVDAEVAKLRQAGLKVMVIDPIAADLQAIGYNLMDYHRRLDVFLTAQRTSTASIQAQLS